jgi:putative phage-type endonuclease
MQIVKLTQGSAEWLAHRAQHFNASDAPAMFGCSSYKTRNKLLHELKTGITPDIDDATQYRFDKGHEFEALGRDLAAHEIDDDLYPVVGTNGKYSASFDGLTMDYSIGFEHKTLNETLRSIVNFVGQELPLEYRVQMEHQMLVSGASRILFMATNWREGEKVEGRHCWYASTPELRAQIIAGWAQFEEDLANYVPEVKSAPVVASPVVSLPAVRVSVDGQLAITSNLADFGAALKGFIEKIPENPSTDQEFADTDAACKSLKKAEDALDAAEASALNQLVDVESMRRLVSDFKALARTTRLQKEKLVTLRKEQIKGEAVAAGVAALAKYVDELNAAMPADYMPKISSDFGGCIKGLKIVDSIKNAVDTELAKAKIEASEIAKRIHTNLVHAADNVAKELLPDLATLLLKAPDDFIAVVAQRKAAEAARLEREREAIRLEELAKIEVASKVAPIVMTPPVTTKVDKTALPEIKASPAPTKTDATINLGAICTRLGFSVTADFLDYLGFEALIERNAKLYKEADFENICAALISHIHEVQA